MTSILLAGGLAIGIAAVTLVMAGRRAARQPDRAWRATGVRFTTDRTYLQAQGIANSIEARKRSASGRRYRRDDKPASVAAMVESARPSAEVVRFRRRQA